MSLFFLTCRDFRERLFYRLGLDFVQGREAETDAVEGFGHQRGQAGEPGLTGPGGQLTAGGGGKLPLRLGGRTDEPLPRQERLQAAVEAHFDASAAGVPVRAAVGGDREGGGPPAPAAKRRPPAARRAPPPRPTAISQRTSRLRWRDNLPCPPSPGWRSTGRDRWLLPPGQDHSGNRLINGVALPVEVQLHHVVRPRNQPSRAPR